MKKAIILILFVLSLILTACGREEAFEEESESEETVITLHIEMEDPPDMLQDLDSTQKIQEVKKAELTSIEDGQELAVIFTFDQEIVEIIFLSPSGEKLTAEDEQVIYESGELRSTYRIIDAEAGVWSVEYDLGSNSNIEYSIIDDTPFSESE